MNAQNIPTENTFLGLTRDLPESRDPETVQARLEELKGERWPMQVIKPPARRDPPHRWGQYSPFPRKRQGAPPLV